MSRIYFGTVSDIIRFVRKPGVVKVPVMVAHDIIYVDAVKKDLIEAVKQYSGGDEKALAFEYGSTVDADTWTRYLD